MRTPFVLAAALVLHAMSASAQQCVDDVYTGTPGEPLPYYGAAGGFTAGNFSSLFQSQVSFHRMLVQAGKTTGIGTSRLLSGDLLTFANASNTLVNKIHISGLLDWFGGCAGAETIEIAYSVDAGFSWHSAKYTTPTTFAGFPASYDAVIDLLTPGISGNQVMWQARLAQPLIPGCTVALHGETGGFDVRYEALTGGLYQNGEPIPLAEALYRGMYETPTPGWTITDNDLSPRGHVKMFRIYDPDAPNLAGTSIEHWDAGAMLSPFNGVVGRNLSGSPRSIYYESAGVRGNFDQANAALWNKILTPADCAQINPVTGKPVYDVTGAAQAPDGACTNLGFNNDAQAFIRFVQGWSDAAKIAPKVQRAWPLGAVLHSNVAVVSPPFQETWWSAMLSPPASAQAKTEAGLYHTFAAAQKNRRTRVVVGALDGMLHAFDGGDYVPPGYPTDPINWTAASPPNHGFFKRDAALAPRHYGDGSEVWAWIPESHLPLMKNLHPAVGYFQPDLRPRPRLDGVVSLADVPFPNSNVGATGFKTIAVVGSGEETSLGAAPPPPYAPPFPSFLAAVDVTSDLAPQPMWAKDWTDPEFHGNTWGVSIAPITEQGLGRMFVVATTSGVASPEAVNGSPAMAKPSVLLYLIDAVTGVTLPGAAGRVDLTALGVATAPAYGVVGSPVMVDADGNGEVDRLYFATTTGEVIKYDTTRRRGCRIGKTFPGNTVFAPIGVDIENVSDTAHPRPMVHVWVGAGAHPEYADGSFANGIYRFDDSERVGVCTTDAAAQSQYPAAGTSIWTAPAIDAVGNAVFLGASFRPPRNAERRLDPCAPGDAAMLFTFNRTGLSIVPAYTLTFPAAVGVGGLRIYDGALLVNTANGKTLIQGTPKWNSAVQNISGAAATATGSLLPTKSWIER